MERVSSTKEEDPVKRAENTCEITQSLIDFTSKHLRGLRTQCATTEEITQQEIRESESKLIKYFSKQLVQIARAKAASNNHLPESLTKYPNTKQWLEIIGLRESVIKGIVCEDQTLDALMNMDSSDVVDLIQKYRGEFEETRRLNKALKQLKYCTERQLQGDKNLGNDDLHWEASGSSSPVSTEEDADISPSPTAKTFPRPSTSSLPANTVLNARSSESPSPSRSHPNSPIPHPVPDKRRLTPPANSPIIKPNSAAKPPRYASGTPPPQKKNQLFPDFPLQKSKSQTQLTSNIVVKDAGKANNKKKPTNLVLGGSYDTIYRRRLSTEGSDAGGSSRGASGTTSPVTSSPARSPPYRQYEESKTTLQVPKSPKTPSMLHAISHRFSNTFKITTCDYCHKQMFLGYKCKECKFTTKLIFGNCDYCAKHVFRGKQCKYCKFKCHRDCATRAAPSCGLPREYLEAFRDTLTGGSPASPRRLKNTSSLPNNHGHLDNLNKIKSVASVPAFASVPDSSSNTSSCSSSTPSSPAPIQQSSASSMTPSTPGQPSPRILINQFQFPDVDYQINGYISNMNGSEDDNADFINTNTSNDSDKTITDTTYSEKSLPDRADSLDSQDDSSHFTRTQSISITLKEWDIPFEDLQLGDAIGTGRFGKVYKGNWHGQVAIKMLNMDPNVDNQAQLQAFKLEVAMLRKTRHDNLVLFMGACMKPPHLAIVTSLCKGHTLYTHIHLRKEKFTMNRTVITASQIAQGMSYLHHRGIIHKDLKTKNIFLENGKVVITDFGLFNVTRLCHGNGKGDFLVIPPGWLCYLSPEIMRSLQAGGTQTNKDLPFSQASDMYAFGTVWYELITGEWPFKNQPPEAIIWQSGRGMKQSLSNAPASRDVKDLLMACWSYKPDNRPDFQKLLKLLERLPKKPLSRSPSHPIHLSRSAESVF